MRLMETYSRNCSVDIKHKPKLYEKYFPLNIDKYITIQTKSGMPAKDYSWFSEVIDLLKPVLDKENIRIVHLGQDSQPLPHVINLNNQTSIGQATFILKKSLAHFGVDSWMAHYCASENVPVVSLYGSTTVANHSPYHFNPNKTIFLESHRNGNKATFAREENPKTVDLIYPEMIAKSVCELLNLKLDYPYNSVYVGQDFNKRVLESDCSVPINIGNLGINNMIMRMDLNFNEQVLIQQLQHSDCSIVTNLPINPQILTQFKPKIKEFVYIINENHKPEFVDVLQKLGLNYVLISYLNQEELNPIKIDYLDFRQIHPQPNLKTIKEIQHLKDKDVNNLYFKSNKFILSNTKIYPCVASWKADKPIKSVNPEIAPIINNDLFCRELNNFLILEKCN